MAVLCMMSSISGDRTTGHQRIDHKFNFKLFDYDTPENFQPCIKLEFFFYKLPDVSSEHFHKHYAHVHSDMTVAARSFGAHKVQRYTQLHQTPEMRTSAKALGMDVLDYDGCSTLWFLKWEDAEAFFTSPEYQSLSADCVHFMDTSRGVKVMAGRELIAFGKAIPDVHTSDGITEYINQ